MLFQIKLSTFILISVLALLVKCSEHVNTDEIIRQKLEDFIPPLMKCRDVLGFTIALVRGNRTVYTSGFGTRDQEKNLSVTASTLFPVASMTKAFSATLAADAVSRGLVTWDGPLKSILGQDFKLQDDFRTEQASVRDCFAHRMGMRNFWGLTTAHMNISREELIMRRLRYFPTRYALRQKWSYSNYNTALGAYAVERATGEKWEDAIYQRIFHPLGMTQSRVSARMRDDDWENFAYSYTTDHDSGEFVPVRDRDVIGKMNELPAPMAVMSTADDMAKWMRFHLRADGMTDEGNDVMKGSALREIHRVSMAYYRLIGDRRPVFPVANTVSAYGMGWYIGTYRGYKKIYHTGSINSYICIMMLLPEVEVGAWGCINSDTSGSRKSNLRKLAVIYSLDLLLGLEPWLNKTTACTYPQPWEQPSTGVTPVQPPPSTRTIDTKQYVGNYVHPAFGRFVIFEDPDMRSQLCYKFGVNMHGKIFPANDESNDDFLITTDPPLAYRIAFQPRYPHGYPISFTRVGDLVHSVSVTYLESNDPPEFIKEVIPERDTTMPVNSAETTHASAENLTLATNSAGRQPTLKMAALLTILSAYIKIMYA